MAKSKRPSKRRNLLDDVRDCWNSGLYAFSKHAIERQHERGIDKEDVEKVIKNGWHEKRKDAYSTEYQTWIYAIRSQQTDERELRIALAFDEDNVLIVTVIDLDI